MNIQDQDSPSKLIHPLAAIAEMQAEIIRRNRAREAELEGGIGVVDLREIETRLGVKLRLNTNRQAAELDIKRLEALKWMSTLYAPSVKRRLLFDRLHRQRLRRINPPMLAVVK